MYVAVIYFPFIMGEQFKCAKLNLRIFLDNIEIPLVGSFMYCGVVVISSAVIIIIIIVIIIFIIIIIIIIITIIILPLF